MHEKDDPIFDLTQYEQQVLALFRAQGLRVTMPRVQVVRALARADRALTPNDIREVIVAEAGQIDVVSVYRILATLEEMNVIHHIGVVNGYRACTLGCEHEARTNHIICESCGSVAEISVPDQAISATDAQMSDLGFSPHRMRIEVLGTCRNCKAS